MGRIGRTANIGFINAGMDDDGSVKVVKDTVFTHIDFAAHRFFSRTAIDMDRRLLSGSLGKSQSRTDAHGSDQVVPASVSNFRQRIILC